MHIRPIQSSFLEDTQQLPTDIRQFVIQASQDIGYQVWHNIIDAADFGVPQHRKRFFLLGVKEEYINNPQLMYHILQSKITTNQTTVEQAIGDLPIISSGQIWKGDDYTPSGNSYVSWVRRFMENNELTCHFTTNHKQSTIERFERIPEGGNWEDIRDMMMTTYTSIDNTHSNIYRRLSRNVPAHTISHYRKSMTIHPTQHRGISFREACRLQSFPDWFHFDGPRDEGVQQQLANAVPPLLAASVAWSIAELWWRHNTFDLTGDNNLEVQQHTFMEGAL
jgi:DNA (cytosine-5)-methyltransferase 1